MHFFNTNDTHECDECGKEFEIDSDLWNEWWEEDSEGNVIHFRHACCPHCGEQNSV